MKKHFFLLATVLSTMFFASWAQFRPTVLTEPSTEHYAKANIPLMVQGEFRHAYPNATDDAWAKLKTGYFVNFSSQDGIHCNVWLNKKGKVIDQIRYLTEAYLPDRVLRQIHSLGSCISIGLVKEVTTELGTAYLVTIDEGATWKVLRISGDEMEVYENHKKG